MQEFIEVRGAKENNLKNIDVKIPRNKLVVFTGVSGSGKSSLAFDTIFAEGQRRYVESLSSYARMFLGQMNKPEVDFVGGLSPAISIDQKTTNSNPRSTVGTVTEIYDYLRVLWASIGIPHCPKCGKTVQRQSIDEIVDAVASSFSEQRIYILAPVVSGKKGTHEKVFSDARKAGYVRVIADGITYELSEEIKLEKNKKHNIDVMVDRLAVREGNTRRISDSVETALSLSGGTVKIYAPDTEHTENYSQNYACPDCGVSLEELSPRMFSFNNPYGACPDCGGLGFQMLVSPELIVPDESLSINSGAIKAPGWGNARENSISKMYYEAIAEKYGFTMDTPFSKIPAEGKNAIMNGTGTEKLELHYDRYEGSGVIYREFEGLVANLTRRYKESKSEYSRGEMEACMAECGCPGCKGKRLKTSALSVTVSGMSISDYTELTVQNALDFISNLSLTDTEKLIAGALVNEISARLRFLISVGLDYLTLSRAAGTLSGGESQRIRLATQIGSGLTGVLYVLDEPSIGLHQRDNARLIETLKSLRDRGNSVLVVEHDENTIRSADFLVDIGPGAGLAGGELVYSGDVKGILKCGKSLTGGYLSGKLSIPVPTKRRRIDAKRSLLVKNASENNLKGIDVRFPLGVFTCVTGVSGSGKSSLVNEILFKTLSRNLNRSLLVPGKSDGVEGLELVDKVINVDQSPIGRTPRSNPATYTGVFTDIRELFSSTAEARMQGFGPDRFSFNVKGGRCEACSGDGYVKIEMHFLPDVFVPCEICGGKRYNRETLDVRFKGKNISEILGMTVDEALVFFENLPKIRKKLQAISDVGLGYIKLGQNAVTLSGGEAQRLKLATELLRPQTGKTVYIFDEPTTGLHSADTAKLLGIFNRLVEAGNTVIVIEHSLDVIKSADYIIDLGPEGGSGGGTLVFEGTPEECAECAESYTGHFLAPTLLK